MKKTMHIKLINMKKTTMIAALGALSLGLAGCGGDEETVAAPADAQVQSSDSKLQAVMLEAEPAGAVSIIETRKSIQPGAEVTVVGRVAGAMEPFTDGYAALVLADKSLETCEMKEGDSCSTPWDACCETSETIKSSRLVVQVADENGRPLETGLKGVNGLTELDELVVTGKVAEGSTEENVIINATGIYRKAPGV